jgi:hypothetical protein
LECGKLFPFQLKSVDLLHAYIPFHSQSENVEEAQPPRQRVQESKEEEEEEEEESKEEEVEEE